MLNSVPAVVLVTSVSWPPCERTNSWAMANPNPVPPGRVPPLALFVLGDKSPLAYGAFTTSSREIFIQYGVLLYAGVRIFDSEDIRTVRVGDGFENFYGAGHSCSWSHMSAKCSSLTFRPPFHQVVGRRLWRSNT